MLELYLWLVMVTVTLNSLVASQLTLSGSPPLQSSVLQVTDLSSHSICLLCDGLAVELHLQMAFVMSEYCCSFKQRVIEPFSLTVHAQVKTESQE